MWTIFKGLVFVGFIYFVLLDDTSDVFVLIFTHWLSKANWLMNASFQWKFLSVHIFTHWLSQADRLINAVFSGNFYPYTFLHIGCLKWTSQSMLFFNGNFYHAHFNTLAAAIRLINTTCNSLLSGAFLLFYMLVPSVKPFFLV